MLSPAIWPYQQHVKNNKLPCYLYSEASVGLCAYWITSFQKMYNLTFGHLCFWVVIYFSVQELHDFILRLYLFIYHLWRKAYNYVGVSVLEPVIFLFLCLDTRGPCLNWCLTHESYGSHFLLELWNPLWFI